jgi:hypothetical protein
VDDRKIALQIRLVRATYRTAAQLPPDVLHRFRKRALALLDRIDDANTPEHLRAELAEVRREIGGDR